MKLLTIIFLLIGSFAFAQNQKINVFIIAGQSNATGQGYVANLNPDQTIPSEVLIYHSGKPHLKGKGEANQWHSLMQASESVDRFGPELGLGFRLFQLIGDSQKIAIIKHAHSGTDLVKQWNPGLSEKDTTQIGDQYKTWLKTVCQALSDLKAQNYQPVLKGIFWQQGENDAAKEKTANAYEANLKHLIPRMRADLEDKKLPFILGLVMPPPLEGVGRDKVRQAQRNVAQNPKIKNVFLVETDDLSQRANDKNTRYPNDHLHFGTDGTWQLGIRYANTWFYHQEKPNK